MNTIQRSILALSSLTTLLIATSCARAPEGGVTAAANPAADVLAANLDPTTPPSKDFFQYANGGWIASHPIPPSEAAWGIGNVVYEDIYAKKRQINESAAASAAPAGSDTRKIGDFWATAMDSAKTDRDGARPLQPELARIDAIRTVADEVSVAGLLAREGCDVFWAFFIGQDPKRSDVIAVQVHQGGLGLPDRDFYFNTEEGVVKARTEYPAHVARLLQLTGQEAAAAQRAGDAVMRFEIALAKASRSLQDRRDPYKNYNKKSVGELTRAVTPHVDWRAMLDSYSLARADTIIVGQPEFLAALDSLLFATPVAEVQDYLRFHLLSTYAAYLGEAFDREHFAFYGTVLDGRETRRPRWKRSLDAEEDAIGMVLGRVFVKEYFPPRTKARYEALVEAIRGAYKERIEALDWMSPATKKQAQEKLASMTKKVGYPDKWKDYSTLAVGRESYAANMRSAATWHFDDAVKKFGKPVDRTEWDMTPQTYNAYYNPSNNEIVLPAGIFLIPGMKDDDVDDATAYGYAGASTIGHEMTHGFDDEGRQFDRHGNLANWWTAEDEKRFKSLADVMVQQFNAYEPLPGLHINGEATLGENIADLGGIVLGLQAFEKTRQYREGKPIAGLTPTQRYFLGYALGWLGHQRDERLRARLLSDVHAPAKWRVNGPFADMPEFYQAFGVQAGDPMWRAENQRVKIW